MENKTRWLILIYRIPREPSRPRVAVWRKLKVLGALYLQDGVVALPEDAVTREQLEWLQLTIREAGGEASLWEASPTTLAEGKKLVEAFRSSRQDAYTDIVAEAERIRRKAELGGDRVALLDELRKLEGVQGGAPEGLFRIPHEKGGRRGAQEGSRSGQDGPKRSRRTGRRERRLMHWATRRGCHVDRTACAWLIKHFLDPEATFSFFREPAEAPEDAELFDVAGARLSHHGEDCSFETFLNEYDLGDPVLSEIAEIIHDADLMDEKYGRPESEGLDAIVRGMQLSLPNDETLIHHTDVLYDGLYAYLIREAL